MPLVPRPPNGPRSAKIWARCCSQFLGRVSVRRRRGWYVSCQRGCLAQVSQQSTSVHSVWCGKNRQPSRLNDRGYGTTAEALEYSKFSCMRTGLGGITAEGAEADLRFPPSVLAALLPRN